MAGDQKTIGIRIGELFVPTSAYVNNCLVGLEERLGKRLEALERPPVGTAVTHNRVSRIEERVAELADRVGALEAAPVTGSWVSTSGSRCVTVTEEKWELIEQVLDAAVAYSDTKWDDGRKMYPVSREAQGLLLAVGAYRKQADQ